MFQYEQDDGTRRWVVQKADGSFFCDAEGRPLTTGPSSESVWVGLLIGGALGALLGPWGAVMGAAIGAGAGEAANKANK